MDARIQKCRITTWMARLFAVISLVASCGVQAAYEIVPPLVSWCAGGWVSYIGLKQCGYPTMLEAANAASTAYNVVYRPRVWAVDSCNLPINYPQDQDATCTGTVTYENGTILPAVLTVRVHYDCPVPIVNPTVPYFLAGSSIDPRYLVMCFRPAQQRLTVTLSGGTEVEPSNGSNNKTLPITATVIDQNTGQAPTNPVQVHISLKVDPTSGGHDHGDSNRPRGGIADVEKCESDGECWSNPTVNGVLEFNFNAPEASGTHTITATCDGCSNIATEEVKVKVDGLEPIQDSSFYTFIGKTDKHSDNHYLTPEAASVLWRIAVSYQIEQRFKLTDPVTKKRTITPPVLHVNDASLKWGGRFDVNGNWKAPHAEHMCGTEVDLRANGNTGAISPNNFRKAEMLFSEQNTSFFLECTKDKKPSQSDPNPPRHKRLRSNLCVSQLDGSQDTNRHYHIRLMGVRK